MKWTVRYSKQTSKFLEKNSIDSLDSDIRKAIKKVVIMENTNINIKKMKGEWKGFYRIRQGDLRLKRKLFLFTESAGVAMFTSDILQLVNMYLLLW